MSNAENLNRQTRTPLERMLRRASVAGVVLVAGAGVLAGALALAYAEFVVGLVLLTATATVAAAAALALQWRHFARLVRALRALDGALDEVERGNLRARLDLPGGCSPDIARLGERLNRLFAGTLTDRQRLRDVAARAFRAQEAERLRIARELQEETAQSLASMLFVLRAARQTTDTEARDGMLDELRENLTLTTDSIRSYARALHPPSLKDLGLVPALESYARSLSGSSGLEIRIIGDDISGILPVEGELALYRVVQEALGNVVRHASATQAVVRVRKDSDYVKTWVEDDGRGFAVEETEARLPCLGLFGMRERALSVGGMVEIDSIPGDGTRVQISIPATSSRAAGAAAPLPIVLRSAEGAPAVQPASGSSGVGAAPTQPG